MNYDDMPAGPEMDRMIAERVMGWNSAGSPYWYENGYNVQSVFEWQPSTNIAHAWEMVERMTSGGRVVRTNTDEHGTLCRIISAGGDGIASNLEESAPLAICRAALLALKPEDG